MKLLKAVHLVQFSFFEAETIQLRGTSIGFLGANGAGKTSLADAIQIAMLGGHHRYLAFNAQSVASVQRRTIRDYCLGAMRSGDGTNGPVSRKREQATSYITLVFEDSKDGETVTAGACINATSAERDHQVLGLYVLPGVALDLDDHLEVTRLNEQVSEQLPLEWETFEARLRSVSKAAGRTPHIDPHPEKYIDELLHALQPRKRHMNKRAFAKAFKQSLRLKEVESVNDFMRNYLVDAQPINKEGPLRQIREVRRLSAQIETVKEHIVRLKDVDRKYNSLAGHYRRRAVAKAVRLQAQMEACDERVSALDIELGQARTLLAEMESKLATDEEVRAALGRSVESLAAAISADPLSGATDQYRQVRTLHERALAERQRDLDKLTLLVRDATAKVAHALTEHDAEAAATFETLTATWSEDARRGRAPTLDAVKQIQERIGQATDALVPLERTLFDVANEAKKALDAALERIKLAGTGTRLQRGEDDVALVMKMFAEHGIASSTVASAVRLTDTRWQSVVESFLGRNRHALLVPAGQEDAAVALIRSARPAIYDVTVVQPEHLERFLGKRPDADSVAALLAGDNELALAYLRRILGDMRCVSTEAELKRHPRSLTSDGMLSANGGTKRIRRMDPGQWSLGVRLSSDDLSMITREAAEARVLHKSAAQRHGDVQQALDACRLARKDATLTTFDAALTTLRVARQDLDSTPEPKALGEPEHVTSMRAQHADAKAELNRRATDAIDLAVRIGAKKTEVGNLDSELLKAQGRLVELQQLHAESIDDEDYDSDLAVSMYERLSERIGAGDAVLALSDLQQTVETASNQISQHEPRVQADFVTFVNEHGINVVDERSQWRKAKTWAAARITFLEGTELANYEREIAQAKEAADASFRSEVAYKMREAIMSLHADIRELNGVLKSGPAFSGNERYAFKASVSPAHKDLHDLVVNSAEGLDDTAPLFGALEGQRSKLLDLLDASARGEDKGGNPLEDYRLLFNFDLAILQDGRDEPVDWLSKRVGVGSNGEHRVPFYVIAGAALASAYKIKAGEDNGAAVMLLDEAFYGMDAQNTYVAAQFLRSLGLQLVMAAPDTDVGKLAPVMDSYYDISRFGPDVFLSENILKSSLHELMITDMPKLNPGLIDRQVGLLGGMDA